ELVAARTARTLVLGRLRLVTGARRAWCGAWGHVGPLLLGAARAGRRDGVGEGLGRRGREAAHPRGLDLLDALRLRLAALALVP
ncbi:MAG: hypothetical protein ACJ77W_13280, partial [Chloroflexota bacterium]